MLGRAQTVGLTLRRGSRLASLDSGVRGRGRPSSRPFSSQLPDSDAASMRSSFEHCVNMVQAAEPGHFAAIQLSPHRGRAALFALRALHLELRNIFEGLTESQAQLMRYQWWRDTIDGVYAGESSPQKVVQVLEPLIQEFGLEQASFQRMISAWEAQVHRSGSRSSFTTSTRRARLHSPHLMTASVTPL